MQSFDFEWFSGAKSYQKSVKNWSFHTIVYFMRHVKNRNGPHLSYMDVQKQKCISHIWRVIYALYSAYCIWIMDRDLQNGTVFLSWNNWDINGGFKCYLHPAQDLLISELSIAPLYILDVGLLYSWRENPGLQTKTIYERHSSFVLRKSASNLAAKCGNFLVWWQWLLIDLFNWLIILTEFFPFYTRVSINRIYYFSSIKRMSPTASWLHKSTVLIFKEALIIYDV